MQGPEAKEEQGGVLEDYEVEWMLKKRPLVWDSHQMEVDYGEEETKKIVATFHNSGLDEALPVLGWYGVGSRWKLV